MFLKISEMARHHSNVCTPLTLQTDKDSHSDGVDSSLSHAVKGVDTPLKLGFHAPWMICLVIFLAVGFLKAYHTVHTVTSQFTVVFCTKWLDFYFDVGEIPFGQIYASDQIRKSCFGGIFAGHDKDVFYRGKFLYGHVFVLYLFGGKNDARHGVLDVEAAVYARIGT